MKKALLVYAYCLLILITIVLADLGKLPLHLLSGVPHYDKAAHLILYGVLYSLLNSFLRKRAVSIVNLSFSIAALITAGLITAEEFSQLLFPSRTFSLMDLLMGYIGIFIASLGRQNIRINVFKKSKPGK